MNTKLTQTSPQNMLDELGIKCSELPIDFNPTESGYKKVDCSSDMLGRVDSILQVFPDVVNGVNSAGSFKVIYDKGLGVLQNVKDHPGFKRANVVSSNIANNDITGQAMLAPLSNTAQIASGVFAAMSMVTGQYYMCQITNELNDINKKLDSLEEFFEDDKESHIKANMKCIKTIHRDYNSIVNNKDRKNTQLNTIQSINSNAISDIVFFRKQIGKRIESLTPKSKKEYIDSTVSKIGKYLMLYYYSVLLYSYSILFELMLSSESDKTCIENIISDIKSAIDKYSTDTDDWKNKLTNFIETSNAYKTNKAVETVAYLPLFSVAYCFIPPLGHGLDVAKAAAANAYLEKDKKNKEENKEKTKLSISDMDNLLDISVLESKKEALEEYNRMMNCKFELIRINDQLYIAG